MGNTKTLQAYLQRTKNDSPLNMVGVYNMYSTKPVK